MDLYRHHFQSSTESKGNRAKDRCLGASLSTVLVGLVLSTIMMTAAFYWYQILKSTSIAERKKRQDLEIGRTLAQFVVSDLKASGYRGCRTLDNHFPIYSQYAEFSNPYRFFKKDRAVFGFVARTSVPRSHLPETAYQRVKENSDVLIIYSIPRKIRTIVDMRTPEECIQTRQSSGIREGSMVLISDCLQGDIFIASAVEDRLIFHEKRSTMNSHHQFSKCYQSNAEVAELQTIAYYLGLNHQSSGDKPSYSLYRDNVWKRAEVILEDVIDFQVEYIIFDIDKGLQILKGSEVLDKQWILVQGVRLKVVTIENYCWEYEVALRNRRRFDHRLNS